MPSPEATILAKTPLPMPWGSDEIRERYAAQIRERAFFSARTIQMDYVRRLQEVCAEYAAGRINAADARTGLQAVLDELGLSDRTGALTDLASARRLNLILRTQRQMAASAARLATQTPDTLDAWPAWRLTRMGARAVPRDDWPQRWHAAGERVGWRGAHRSQMVALKSSPIWQALGDGAGGFRDAIGNPYPPFAFGSGLDWVDVSRDEALRLGLEPDGQAPQQADLSPSDVEIAEAVAKTGLGPEFFRPRPTFNRSARRAAALLRAGRAGHPQQGQAMPRRWQLPRQGRPVPQPQARRREGRRQAVAGETRTRTNPERPRLQAGRRAHVFGSERTDPRPGRQDRHLAGPARGKISGW